MWVSFLILGLFSLPLFAAEPFTLKNDREGKSYYSSSGDRRAMNRALKQVSDGDVITAFRDTLNETDVSRLCSFSINASLTEKLRRSHPRFQELEGAILKLRQENEIDDVSARLLLTAHAAATQDILLPKKKEELFLPGERKTVDDGVEAIRGIEKKLKTQCFDEAWKGLYGELMKLDKNMNDRHVEALLVEAYERQAISYDMYLGLERARTSELQGMNLSLRAYYRKIRSVRNQFPLRDPNEKSDFVTQKSDGLKMSHRQRLYEGYSDIQIMLMANVIKKLRTRLESPKAEILIYDRNQGVETITLEPMERFRLAIKLLRKEMSLLALNTYFNGRAPSYLDLMTAAYETGLIPASELEEVAGLQDIWNPKKTFWEKAQVWVRSFSTVATIALPPPYGFIPALAVVVIEMTAGKKNDKTEDPTVLF